MIFYDYEMDKLRCEIEEFLENHTMSELLTAVAGAVENNEFTKQSEDKESHETTI